MVLASGIRQLILQGNVRPKDLRKAGHEIQTSIGWNDLVDTLRVFTKVVWVNPHEVQVEEKRKIRNEASPSQRLETKEQKKVTKKTIKEEKSKQNKLAPT